MSVNRNQDLRMNAGRATIDLEYDIGFDDSGKIHVSSAQACIYAFAGMDWLQIVKRHVRSFLLPKRQPADSWTSATSLRLYRV